MIDSFSGPGEAEELRRDMMLAEALASLDPASTDPNYWFRFRHWVLAGAGRELSRRRLMQELTVGDVLTAWARTLIPTAALAAGVAAVMLMRASAAPMEQQRPIGVEELLVSDLPLETVPVLLSPEAAVGFVAFASDIY
jgi:hypothetical protein